MMDGGDSDTEGDNSDSYEDTPRPNSNNDMDREINADTDSDKEISADTDIASSNGGEIVIIDAAVNISETGNYLLVCYVVF